MKLLAFGPNVFVQRAACWWVSGEAVREERYTTVQIGQAFSVALHVCHIATEKLWVRTRRVLQE